MNIIYHIIKNRRIRIMIKIIKKEIRIIKER